MLKTLCQMSAPNPIKHYLDMAQVNTPATGCWLFWDVSFFLFMFCFLNHSVTNLKQMSKPLIFFNILDLFIFLFLDNSHSECTTLNSSNHFFSSNLIQAAGLYGSGDIQFLHRGNLFDLCIVYCPMSQMFKV